MLTLEILLLSFAAGILMISGVLTVHEITKPNSSAKDQKRLRIGVRREFNWYDSFIERFIFFRFSATGYNNRPKSNTRLIPTFFTTCVAALGVFISFSIIKKFDINFVIGDERKSLEEVYHMIALSFIGLWLGLFWKEKKDMHSKWEYLADLYNRMLEQPFLSETPQYFSCRESLKIALVIDSLTMGMWAHDSYYDTFESVITKAKVYENKYPITYERMLSNLKQNGVGLQEAHDVLATYQAYIINIEKEAQEKIPS